MLRTRLQKKLNANMDDIWSLDVLPVAFNAVFYSSYSCCILTVRILGLVFTGSYYSNSNVASLSGPVVSVHFTLFYFFLSWQFYAGTNPSYVGKMSHKFQAVSQKLPYTFKEYFTFPHPIHHQRSVNELSSCNSPRQQGFGVFVLRISAQNAFSPICPSTSRHVFKSVYFLMRSCRALLKQKLGNAT